MKRFFLSGLLALYCVLLAGCGSPARSTKSVAPLPVVVETPLACQATASATVLNAFGDANGNLLPNTQAPTVNVSIAASRAGIPSSFQIVRVQTSSSDFRVETDPAASGTNLSQIVMRPYKKGVHTATISITSASNPSEIVTCGVQVELKVTTPPVAAADIRVMIVANGAGPALTLSEGQGATINWAALNATACQLLRDGVPLPNQPAVGILSGEFTVGPFANATNAPLSTVYSVECGATGAQPQRAAVGITVNPVPKVDVQIVGSGAAKTIHVGDSVDANWTSSFATGGCLVSNGVTGDIAPPTGAARFNAVASNFRFTVTCRDNNRGVATGSVQITALNPRVSIVANGMRSTYVAGVREPFTLSWVGADVTGCSVNPTGASSLTGSVFIPAVSFKQSTSYQVTCQSYFGTVSDLVTVIYVGDWYQTEKADFGNQKDCNTFCSNLGRQNVDSPDGSKCASGELYPPSAVGKIALNRGCGSYSCTSAHGAANGRSDGGALNAFCWGDGQKTNKNNSDEVMGCFCR